MTRFSYLCKRKTGKRDPLYSTNYHLYEIGKYNELEKFRLKTPIV